MFGLWAFASTRKEAGTGGACIPCKKAALRKRSITYTARSVNNPNNVSKHAVLHDTESKGLISARSKASALEAFLSWFLEGTYGKISTHTKREIRAKRHIKRYQDGRRSVRLSVQPPCLHLTSCAPRPRLACTLSRTSRRPPPATDSTTLPISPAKPNKKIVYFEIIIRRVTIFSTRKMMRRAFGTHIQIIQNHKATAVEPEFFSRHSRRSQPYAGLNESNVQQLSNASTLKYGLPVKDPLPDDDKNAAE